MSNFSPNFIAHSEIIGDSSSSEHNLGFLPTSLEDRNSSTNIISKTIMNVLEFFLMITMLPFAACQRIYENDHLMVMLRVILEVVLELVMWLILAGVSILTSAALIFDDLYCGKSGSDGYRRLVKNYADESTIGRDELQPPSNLENNLSSENEWPEETGPNNQECRLPAAPSPQNEVQQPSSEKKSKAVSYTPEKDEDCVNFSFYKPLRHDLILESVKKQKK